MSKDINDMSKKLNRTFKSLHESEQEKNSMIEQLSHDIKTPITSINTTIEAILDGIIPKNEVRHHLNIMNHQTERLNSLVEELTYITYSNSRKTDLFENVFVDQLIIDVLSEFEVQLRKEHREVKINVNPNGASIYTKKEQVYRILFNLVNNAIKYSNDGTEIIINAAIEENKLRFDVTDFGKGINSSNLENVFQRLYRVDESRNSTTGGHGLGLYIAKELVEQLGGNISVKRQEGKGSTFTFTLPIDKGACDSCDK